MDFFAAWALTLIIEGAALFILFRKQYGTTLIARNAIIASSLTLPFVWFVFPSFGFGWELQTAVSETFATLAEGLAYMLLFKKIAPKEAMLASVACNWASFIFGLAVS